MSRFRWKRYNIQRWSKQRDWLSIVFIWCMSSLWKLGQLGEVVNVGRWSTIEVLLWSNQLCFCIILFIFIQLAPCLPSPSSNPSFGKGSPKNLCTIWWNSSQRPCSYYLEAHEVTSHISIMSRAFLLPWLYPYYNNPGRGTGSEMFLWQHRKASVQQFPSQASEIIKGIITIMDELVQGFSNCFLRPAVAFWGLQMSIVASCFVQRTQFEANQIQGCMGRSKLRPTKHQVANSQVGLSNSGLVYFCILLKLSCH